MNYLQSSLLTLLVGLNLLTGCGSRPTDVTNETQTSTPPTSSEPLDVTVSILPQEYFVKKIGGDHIKVNVMVEPGASPATYEPKPQQMKALTQAEAYVSIGVPFEKAWMGKIQESNSLMLVVDSAQGIERMGNDPHIWLSPQLVKVQANNIYQGLVTIDSENQGQYKANLEEFLAEVDQLDQKIRQSLAGIEHRKFIVFHPAWGYFARDYNLEQIPIELGGQEPSAAELATLVKKAKAENIKVIFAQPEFSTKEAETIAKEIDGEVLLISPLAANWSNNLLQVSQTFGKVFNKEGNGN
jgi:zinc transport system substrate-binding protein